MIHKSKQIEILVRPTLSNLGEVKHEVVTTKELRSWVIQVKVNGKVNQAQRVYSAADQALATKTMLRSEQVLGNHSSFTRAAAQGAAYGAKPNSKPGDKLRPVMA